MKHQWMAYVIVGLLSIGAGVAIAGLPNNVSVDATVIAPAGSSTTTSTPPTTDVSVTEAPSTSTSTSTTTAAPSTSTSTSTPTSTSIPDTSSTVAPITDRADLIVGAANGAGIAGTAARAATAMEAAGYSNVLKFDGSDVVELTTIYYADGFEAEAQRMADDFGLLPQFVAPLADAPAVKSLTADIQLLAYIGIDRAR
jgi:hypothetical protein